VSIDECDCSGGNFWFCEQGEEGGVVAPHVVVGVMAYEEMGLGLGASFCFETEAGLQPSIDERMIMKLCGSLERRKLCVEASVEDFGGLNRWWVLKGEDDADCVARTGGAIECADIRGERWSGYGCDGGNLGSFCV
jgi:hypothetical protein